MLADEVVSVVNIWHIIMDTATVDGYALNEAFLVAPLHITNNRTTTNEECASGTDTF